MDQSMVSMFAVLYIHQVHVHLYILHSQLANCFILEMQSHSVFKWVAPVPQGAMMKLEKEATFIQYQKDITKQNNLIEYQVAFIDHSEYGGICFILHSSQSTAESFQS